MYFVYYIMLFQIMQYQCHYLVSYDRAGRSGRAGLVSRSGRQPGAEASGQIQVKCYVVIGRGCLIH